MIDASCNTVVVEGNNFTACEIEFQSDDVPGDSPIRIKRLRPATAVHFVMRNCTADSGAISIVQKPDGSLHITLDGALITKRAP